MMRRAAGNATEAVLASTRHFLLWQALARNMKFEVIGRIELKIKYLLD